MNTKEMIEVMQAFVNDKEIEWKYRSISDVKWKLLCSLEPLWDWSDCDYRIKKETKYIPFKWQDREQLRGKWVRLKEKNEEFLISGFELTKSPYVFFNEDCISFRELFEEYEFLNGNPCGKLEE